MKINRNGWVYQLPRHTFAFANGEKWEAAWDVKNWRWHLLTPAGPVKLDGVSGIVKQVGGSSGLVIWAKRLALKKTRELLIAGGHVLTTNHIEQHPLHIEILDKILARAEKEDTIEFEQAGQTGHDAHSHLEQIIKAELRHDETRKEELLACWPVDQRAAASVAACLFWMAEHEVEFLYSERPVLDPVNLFAGTCDGAAWVKSCSNRACCPVPYSGRRLCIIDFKTSNSLRVSYLWQGAAYRHCLQLLDGVTFDDTWVLRLPKDCDDGVVFDPWCRVGTPAFDEDFRGYLNALAAVRSLHAGEEWANEMTRDRRALAAEQAAAEKLERDKIACPKSSEYKGVRLSRCFEDGTQCQKCKSIYEEKHK